MIAGLLLVIALIAVTAAALLTAGGFPRVLAGDARTALVRYV
jgi:hypothetical protein